MFGSAGAGAGFGFELAGGIFSAITGSEDAKKQAAIQKQEIATQMQIESQKETSMELTARRQMTENVRNAQMSRSMALAAGTNQGAQFGTGVQGGEQTVMGQAGVNSLGISQNLQIGRNIFGLTTQLDSEKIAMADAQSKAASDAAFGKMLSGIGSALI